MEIDQNERLRYTVLARRAISVRLQVLHYPPDSGELYVRDGAYETRNLKRMPLGSGAREDNMGKILCCTRGGQASYRTQDAAIALSKERGDEPIALYEADYRFLDKAAAPIMLDVENEIAKMGEFLPGVKVLCSST